MKLKYFILFFAAYVLIPADFKAQDVPYVPTPMEVVETMLTMAEVTEKDVVYDLGCGDGRIVVTAASKYGARGVGIDSSPQRIEESKANADASGVSNLVEFKQQDLFKTDFSEATVVTLYLLTHINKKLRPILFEQLEPGTRIVSHAFDMGEWEPEETKEVDGRTIYFWRIPENVSGRWEVQASAANGESVVMDLKQEFNKVSGTVQMNGKTCNINESKLEGNSLELTCADGMRFSGQIDNDTINGSFTGNANNGSNFILQRSANTRSSLDNGL